MGTFDREEHSRGEIEKRLQRFLRWMEANGVHLRGCTLKPCEGDGKVGFGVYTTDNYPEDGILMVTPLALAITPMTALQDPLLGSIFAELFKDENVDDRLVIMLFLLVQRLRGDSSFWAPYLEMLPTKFGMTLCFTEEELLELKGTALYKATKIQEAGLREHFNSRVKGLAETILVSIGSLEREVKFEDFLWANCIFWTRALNVPCPHSLVLPKTLQTPPSLLHEKEHSMVNDVAIGQAVMTAGQQYGSECSASSHRHGMMTLGISDNIEVEELGGKFSAVSTIKFERANDAEVEGFNCTSSGMRQSGEPEPEQTTIWVEGLVPGIDFCNHASQAAALWEVDDQKGSASGVQYSMYLVTAPGIAPPSNTEVKISYGNKGNEELLYLYGFVLDDNPDDYLMIHCPREAIEKGVCSEAKLLLLEEQRLPLRWLLPGSLLKDGQLDQQGNKLAIPYTSKYEGSFDRYSWSGHRKPPPDLEKQVFPEDLMAALRIIAMTEDEVEGTTALLAELSDPESQRVPSAEDIRAAVWEICGNAGALQLLQDLLTSKMLEVEEGTGSEDVDADFLEKDAQAQIAAEKQKQQGSAYAGNEEFIEKNLLSRNKRACIVYRKGQKHLVHCFLKEAEHALEWWIT